MEAVRLTVAAVNTLVFAAMLFLAVVAYRREDSARIRAIWVAVALATGAVVLGGVQKMMFQVSIFGWASPRTAEFLRSDWQLLQSILVFVLAIVVFVSIRRATRALAVSERVAGRMMGRIDPGLDVERLELTPREREVLVLIGEGKLTDAELAEELFISASTVQSHVKSLFRKTGVRQRSDLVALANQTPRRRM